MSTTRSRPPPAPTKLRSTRSALPLANPDSLAQDLDNLAISRPPPLARAKPQPRTALPTRREPPPTTLKPLGRSTLANRPPPALPPPSSTSQPPKRAQPSVPHATSPSLDVRHPSERAKDAMKSLNSAIACLASFNKTGYKAVSTSPASSAPQSARSGSSASMRGAAAQGSTRDKVEMSAKQAGKALRELRELVEEGTLARKKVEVEKAAGSVVASLVEMELYRPALSELSVMRSSLLSWWSTSPPLHAPPPSSPPTAYFPAFFLPLPPASFASPPSLSETLNAPPRPSLVEIVPLVLALQQYLLGCLFRLPVGEMSSQERVEGLATLFKEQGAEAGPVQWRKLLEGDEEAKGAKEGEREALLRRIDGIMSSMFATLTKGCTGEDGTIDPEALLALRTYALLFYTTLSTLSPSPLQPTPPPVQPEKLAAFHDQLRKVLLLYGRSAEALGHSEARIGENVREAFERVVKACEERGVGREGGKWRDVCEVVLHIARRANDLPTIDRVSRLLGISSTSSPSSPSFPTEPAVDPAVATSHLCAKTLNALSVFETWCQSQSSPPSSSLENDAVLPALQSLLSLLPSLTRLRTSSPLDLPSAQKLDKTLERVRYALSKHLKGGKRAEALLVLPGAKPPLLGEVEKKAREVLDRLAAHSARALAEELGEDRGEEAKKARKDLATTGVDSLLLLAYSSMVIDDRSTHSTSFAYLERCLPLVGFTPSTSPSSSSSSTSPAHPTVDLTLHYSLRTLSSAFYNLGGTLFNAQQPDGAVRFCKRACEVSAAALHSASTKAGGDDELSGRMGALRIEGGREVKEEESGEKAEKERKEREEAVRDLERLMARRWELLGLASHAIGDKKGAYEAYTASILSQPSSVLSTLSADASHLSLIELTVAHPALFKLIQRSTRLGVFDLLLPAASLPLTFSSPATSVSPPSPPVRGILLELQLSALDSVSDKPEARRAVLAILKELEETYEAEEFPLRRARTLVAKLGVVSGGGGRGAGVEPAELLREIEELCRNESLGSDAALKPFIPQFLSLSHLYLAFHAHQTQPSSPSSSPSLLEQSDSVFSSARQALRILRSAMEDDLPPSPSASTKKSSPAVSRTVAFQSPAKTPVDIAASPPRTRTVPPPVAAAATRARRPTTRAAATPARTTRRTKAVVVQEQVTPPRPRRGVVRLVEAEEVEVKEVQRENEPAPKTPVKKGEKGEVKLDDVEKVYGLFETMANLLGTLGNQLLKIAFLKFLRRLYVKLPSSSSIFSPSSNDAFVFASSQLGHEFLRLGKSARAGFVFAQAEARIKATAVRQAAQVEYWLLYAEYLAMLGNHERAAQAYDAALQLANELEKEAAASPPASATVKIVERTVLLRRTALAAHVCSVLLQRKGELSRSLAPAMQAMRLGTRALNNISRLAPSPASSSSSSPDSAFDAPPQDHVTPLADAASINQRKNSMLPSGAHAGLSWQLAENLLDSTLRVASLHFIRGSPKSANFYAQQAFELAEDLGSSRMMARALALRADVRMHWDKLDEANRDLDTLDRLVGTTSCPEATESRRLRADLHVRASMKPEAYKLYLDAQKSLETFVSTAADRELGNSPVKQQTPARHLSPAQAQGSYFSQALPSPSPTAIRNTLPLDLVLPAVHGHLLRMQVHLLQGQNKTDETQRLLRRLAKLASLEEDKADELKLLAALQIQDLLARSSSDPILGMLPDSVLSMPVLGIAASGAIVKIGTPRTGPTILNSLKDIETLLSRAIAFSTSRSYPSKLRDLALTSATMRTMQASVGKQTRRSNAGVAHTLDLAVAVTLRREMLDAVEHKISTSARHDDLIWPATTLPPSSSSDDSYPEHLYGLRERYRIESAEPNLTDSALSSVLPDKWSAISIHLTPEHDSLIIVRHRRASDPLLFKLPLDRIARREGEDDGLTYEVAIAELKNIIENSNAGTQSAKHVQGKEERVAWWQTRKELDERVQTLLQTMEDAWLGAFKSVLYDSREIPAEGFAAFKARFERILKRSMVRAAGSQKTTRFKLDDSIVECLAALPSTSREEDLEDLFYYAAESFHFSGVPLAHDETDVDQVVVDLREALEELHGTKSAPKRTTSVDEHTFLILDKTLQSFPWESLPCLRGRSVSRLPSLAFLRDRLDLAAASQSSSSSSQPHDLVVDPTKASFVLNPGGDLKNTQKTFEPWLEERKTEVGWTGVVARAPLEEEMRAFLAQKELFLYFGHGGAEQYIRSQTIRHFPRCAVTMLWGCSSGMLREQGDFDPVGTPYHYMVAGCPALVANLWDVTDKDIDKFAFSVFRKTGLAAPDPPALLASPSVSLTAAIAQSRDVCTLPYLNGAAPVVYGIPVRFSSCSTLSASSSSPSS